MRAIGRNADDRRQGLGVPPGSYGRGVHRRLARGCTLFAARQRCDEDAQAPPTQSSTLAVGVQRARSFQAR